MGIKNYPYLCGRIYILTDRGNTYSRPLEAFPLLLDATPEQRARFEIGLDGDDVRWDDLDEDIHISSFFVSSEPDLDNSIAVIFKRFPWLNVSEVARALGMATLAAEVYLWTAKVSTGNQSAGGDSDITKAKGYLTNLVNNYGLALEGKFVDIWDVSKKLGKEVIFAVHYGEGEAQNNLSSFTYMSDGRGLTMEQVDENGERFGDPFKLNGAGIQRFQYIDDMFLSYDLTDTRRAATFKASYDAVEFKTSGRLKLYGTHVCKNIGYTNEAGVHQFIGDFVYYRLAWVYLSLAEIANYEGRNADVENYINLVRERAYGAKWNKATYGYSAGSYTDNELAILAEKDKEMLQEGQRWYDLRRMTLTKGGKHLVFCPEANPRKNGKPVLNESDAYKLLWPIDKTVMNSDKELNQTPGYN